LGVISDKVGWRFSIQTCNGRFVPSALSSSSCAGFGERSGGRGIPPAAAARGVSDEIFYKRDPGKKGTVVKMIVSRKNGFEPGSNGRLIPATCNKCQRTGFGQCIWERKKYLSW
jgi:hypothetical protein